MIQCAVINCTVDRIDKTDQVQIEISLELIPSTLLAVSNNSSESSHYSHVNISHYRSKATTKALRLQQELSAVLKIFLISSPTNLFLTSQQHSVITNLFAGLMLFNVLDHY